MTERVLKWTAMEAITPHSLLLPEEYEAAGYKQNYEFDEAAVLFSFRLSMGHQHTPIRVWFLKADVPEADWYAHARKMALEFAGLSG